MEPSPSRRSDDMPVLISMLRGVNVGGHHRIKMDALRALYEKLGLQNARTYVQSGNVVFQTEEQDLLHIAAQIEKGIQATFGFSASVVLRTRSEMEDVVARNPFAQREEMNPAKLLVYFLGSDPGPEACRQILEIPTGPDELRMDTREVFIYFPDGMGKSKLPWPKIERLLKVPATGRNWNSVLQLLQMAEVMEKSGAHGSSE
jgi:uncharacterized protein (DUF1697 family)